MGTYAAPWTSTKEKKSTRRPSRRSSAKRSHSTGLASRNLRRKRSPKGSDVPEHRRKDGHDDRRPRGVDRQVIRLPSLEGRERSAPSQKADVEHGGPRQVDEENHVLAQGGHAVRGESELGDARGDGPQRYRVGQ